mmetsp:Transcript_13375/g.35956  ORF Transcript_13375/g.35956 Transcript_13375/m.35956 type:complete len:148 (+) Transcript_13375:193-636(+)
MELEVIEMSFERKRGLSPTMCNVAELGATDEALPIALMMVERSSESWVGRSLVRGMSRVEPGIALYRIQREAAPSPRKRLTPTQHACKRQNVLRTKMSRFGMPKSKQPAMECCCLVNSSIECARKAEQFNDAGHAQLTVNEAASAKQ